MGLLPDAAQAQVALIVGSVRDQHGSPIEGAVVSSGRASTTTDDAGTFALAVAGARSIQISCRFCAGYDAPIVGSDPIVAIVRRFDALTGDAPSAWDLANLPYAHVESAIALRPFTMLRQSTLPFPGSQVSDRGVEPPNALLIDAGVPDYDVAFNASPYTTVPAHYVQDASVRSPAGAFLYGDQAGSGIVNLDAFGGDNADMAMIGGDQTLRLQTGSDFARLAAGTYSNFQESRQRADGSLNVPLSTAQTLAFSGGSEQGRTYSTPANAIAQNFTFGNATFTDVQPDAQYYANFVTDRGAYAAAYHDYPLSDVWADSAVTAGFKSHAPIAFFADASLRDSSGIYDAQSFRGEPRIAGTLQQTRLDAGVETSGDFYDITAGAGWFGVGYTGGIEGYNAPSYGHLATPSVSMRLFTPNGRWSTLLEASDAFTLPTLWQQYAIGDNYLGLTYDRNSTYTATVEYTDTSRIRVALEGVSQRTVGYTNGNVTSAGLSVEWQIATDLSLRAWSMHVTNTAIAEYGEAPAYHPPQPTAQAIWLTYDRPNALRIDAIYRRDLLNNAPFYHFDGDVSGPLAARMRWYASVEDRQRTVFAGAGVRFTP